jgi:hypothetical protein
MSAMLDKFFPSIMFFETVFLALVIFSTLYFYLNWIKPKHIVGSPLYVLILLIFVTIGLSIGWEFGIKLACSTANTDNHCGVWGFLITGPISAALAICLAELALYLGGNLLYSITQKKAKRTSGVS